MGLVYKTQEYKLLTDTWMRRKAHTTNAWKEVQLDDVPDSIQDARRALTERKAGPLPPAAPPKITRHN